MVCGRALAIGAALEWSAAVWWGILESGGDDALAEAWAVAYLDLEQHLFQVACHGDLL